MIPVNVRSKLLRNRGSGPSPSPLQEARMIITLWILVTIARQPRTLSQKWNINAEIDVLKFNTTYHILRKFYYLEFWGNFFCLMVVVIMSPPCQWYKTGINTEFKGQIQRYGISKPKITVISIRNPARLTLLFLQMIAHHLLGLISTLASMKYSEEEFVLVCRWPVTVNTDKW